MHCFATVRALAGTLAIAGALLGQATLGQAQQPPPATFRGAGGESVSDPLALNAGLTVIRAQNNGNNGFGVNLVLPNPGETALQCYHQSDCVNSFLVYNESSAFSNAAEAELVDRPGQWYLVVNASGPFQLTVEQPLPRTVSPVAQSSFTGRGPSNVSPYFSLTGGAVTLSAQSTGSQLRVWLYRLDDLGGGPVSGGVAAYDGRIIDLTFDPTLTSAPLIVDPGTYLIVVDNLLPTETWTVSVQ